jgi:hypothetical protein
VARKATIADDTHRRKQRRYRKRIRAEREPEIGRVDTAVTAAVYAYLRKVSKEGRGTEGREDLDFILATSHAVLVAMKQDPAASLRVLKRRLAKASRRFDKLLGGDGDPVFVILP